MKHFCLLLKMFVIIQLGGSERVTDAETRLALLKRQVLASVQAQARTPTSRTPQSAKGTFTPIQRCMSDSGGNSSCKREKFIQVSW